MARNIMVAVLIGLVSSSSLANAEKITVVLSRPLPPYEEAAQGFSQPASWEIVKLNMEGDKEKGRLIMESLATQKNDLVLTIGTEATLAAKQYLTNIPVVYTMVLDKVNFSGPSAGVLIQIDMDTQIKYLKQLFLSANRVGVLYNGERSGPLIDQARRMMENRGFQLVPIAVANQSDVATALGKLTRDQIDILWTIIDPTISQAQVVQLMVEHALKEKIPFIGLSRFQVKAGALAAFSVDFRDIGEQSAVLARQLITTKRSQAVEYPRRLILYLNAETQGKIGVKNLPRLSGIQIVTE